MDCFIGQIELFPYGFAPQGWVYCDGRSMVVSMNQALFSLIGITFGGDGIGSFALPDLRNASPHPDLHYCICATGIYPPRD